MERPFQARPRGRKPIINITPLIDVMFLLLIFFMVSSTFRSQPGFDVNLPRAASATPQETAPGEIVVRADGNILLDGQPVTAAELRAGISLLIEADPEAALTLRGDARAAYEDVMRALDIAREAGGSRLILPMQPAHTENAGGGEDP